MKTLALVLVRFLLCVLIRFNDGKMNWVYCPWTPNKDVINWSRSEKDGKYYAHHDSVITVQTESQIEALRDYDSSKPIG